MARKDGTQIVVVADDHDDTLALICQLLSDEAYEVICVHDGQEALDVHFEIKSQGDSVDLHVLDYDMPRMKGVTVAQELYDAGEDADTALLTGSADPILTARRNAAHIPRRWDKPIKAEELKANIRTVLDLRRKRFEKTIHTHT